MEMHVTRAIRLVRLDHKLMFVIAANHICLLIPLLHYEQSAQKASTWIQHQVFAEIVMTTAVGYVHTNLNALSVKMNSLMLNLLNVLLIANVQNTH